MVKLPVCSVVILMEKLLIIGVIAALLLPAVKNLRPDKEKVMEELRHALRPEFINRVDEIIIFNPLTKDVIYEILDKIIEEIEERLKDKDLKIKLTDEARNYLVDIGYDVNYGARPLKRAVSRSIETILAEKIINGEVKYGDTVTFDYNGELFVK